MTPALRVHLFGSLRLVYGTDPVPGLNAARLQSTLAYLLLHADTPQSRQQMAFRFWPETSDAQAQTNLRQLLHTLRHRLPQADDFLDIQPTTILWRADAPFTLDVAEFEAALVLAKNATGQDEIAALEAAVALYTGELLPGCYDDWIVSERERLAQAFVMALDRLVIALEERRDYPAAIAHAQRLLRHDPIHEAAYRHLMRIHAASGDRAAALRVYHTCVSMLEQELGVDPMPATQEIYQALLRADGAPVVPSPMRANETAFVGRHDPWQRIQKVWRAARQGAPHTVCILGEPGIGKSRLAAEMARWVQQQGMTVVHTRAYSAEGELAYAPLVEALRGGGVSSALARLDPVWLTELARLQPDLLVRFPDLPRPEPLTERWQRQRLFEALVKAVLGPGGPTLLVVDDLQWCDGDTLEWLHYLLRYDRRAPLLVLLTARPEEMPPDHPAVAFLRTLRTGEGCEEIDLEPLDGPETAQLASAVADRPLSAKLTEQIYRVTEGNPLFIAESVRAGLGGEGAGEIIALPPKVHAVVSARLGQLSAPARQVAGYAAVIGRLFTFDVLAAAWEADETSLVRGLDELWQRRIVREHGATAYDFAHDRIREVAYTQLLTAQRRMMHRRIARALETVHGADLDGVSAQLARHYEAAGELAQAIRYLQGAADAARRLFSYPESIAFLDRAIALINALPASPTTLQRELELQLMLCEDWSMVTNHLGDGIKSAYERALLLCRQLDSTPDLFAVSWGLHQVALYRGEYAQSLEMAQRCLAIAQEIGDPGLLVEAHHAMWAPYHCLGQHTEALVHTEAGLALYQFPAHEALSPHYGWHDAAACALEIASLSLWQLGFLDQAAQAQQALIDHAQRMTQIENSADGNAFVAIVYHLLRAPALAQPFAEMTLRTGIERGSFGLRISGAITLGWSLTMQGRAEEGLPLIQQAVEEDQALGHSFQQSQKFVKLAEAQLTAGQAGAAIATLDRGIAAFVHFRDLVCAPDLWTLKGTALLALGREDAEVEACYRTALALAQELGAKTSELNAAVGLARLRQCQGRGVEAVQVLRPIYEWFTEGFATPDLRAGRDLLDELVAEMPKI